MPLNPFKLKNIVVLGDDGHDKTIIAGGGSGHVINSYVVTPLDGIKNLIQEGYYSINISYANTSSLESAK